MAKDKAKNQDEPVVNEEGHDETAPVINEEKAEEAPAMKEEKVAKAAPEEKPAVVETKSAGRKYTYKGPEYDETDGHLVAHSRSLRPAQMTDEEIDKLLTKYPDLARWWITDYQEE